jgi:hypothetical protein
VGVPGLIELGPRFKGGLKLEGSGAAKASGSLTREGDPTKMEFGAWAGSLKVDFNITGKALLTAGAYIHWKLLWMEGDEEIYEVKDWQVAGVDIKGSGSIDSAGGSDFHMDKFDFTLGPPKPVKISEKKGNSSINTHRGSGGEGGPIFMKRMDGGDGDDRAAQARAAFARVVARDQAAAPAAADPAAAPSAAGAAPPQPAAAGAPGEAKDGVAMPADPDPAKAAANSRKLAEQGKPDGLGTAEPALLVAEETPGP